MPKYFYYNSLALYTKNYFRTNLNINLKNSTKRKICLHIFKSDAVVLISIKLFIILINFFSIIFYFKFIFKKNFYQSTKLIKILKTLLSPLSLKIDELIYAMYQLNTLEEKAKIFKLTNLKLKDFYDYIVIGSGPGGSISSFELRKNNKDVLMIEEGKWIDNFKNKHPGNEFYYKWRNSGISTTVFPNLVSFASAKCLGGGSEINSGLYHTIPKEFIKETKEKFKVNDFSIQGFELIDREFRNKFTLTKNFPENSKGCFNIFKEGAHLNNYELEQIMRFVNYKENKVEKKTITAFYIDKYLKHGGKILINNKVNKISYDSKKDYWSILTSKKKLIKCKKLILCCGAIHSSKLLLTNRILDKNDSKNIKNFYFHPMIKFIIKFKNRIKEDFDKDDIHPFQLMQFYPKFVIGKAASGKQFMKISSFADKELTDEIEKYHEKMSIYHATFSFGVGKLFKIPFSNNYIKFYNLKNSNLELVKNACKELCKIFFATNKVEKIYILGKKNNCYYRENFKEKIDDNIKKIHDIKFSSVHILGGIPFGEAEICPADSYGKLKKQKNIYVNDSSLINSKLLKNPQGTVMALAKRNINKILAEGY